MDPCMEAVMLLEEEPEEILVMVDGREMALHDVLPEDEAQVLSH